jgi:signal transduction protein with GAF and PtsI domain
MTDQSPQPGDRVRQLEEMLEARNRDLESLQHAHTNLSKRTRMFERIHPLFLSPEAIEENLDFVMDVLLDEIEVEAGSILLIDFEANEFFFVVARGPVAEEIMKIRFPSDKGIAGACAANNMTLSVSNVESDPRFYREITDQLGFTVRSLLAVPVTYKGHPIGVIELINKQESPEFLGQEVDAVEKVAVLAGKLIALGERLRGGE